MLSFSLELSVSIQSRCRQYFARLHYTKIKKAVIVTLCAWRGKVARKELKRLKMASKETGALQEAKNKLEKQVEELTWRLHLEKRMRSDLEEAKTQENAKLQSTLKDIQLQFNKTKEILKKEREAVIKAAKMAAEQAPVVHEIPVIDTEMLDKLTHENEKLKALVSSLEKKIDDTEQKFEETNKLCEERLKQALDAESKIIQLKTASQSFQEKLSDMEYENQLLWQQGSSHSTPVKRMSEHLATQSSKSMENGHHENEDHKEPLSATASPSSSPSSRFSFFMEAGNHTE